MPKKKTQGRSKKNYLIAIALLALVTLIYLNQTRTGSLPIKSVTLDGTYTSKSLGLTFNYPKGVTRIQDSITYIPETKDWAGGVYLLNYKDSEQPKNPFQLLINASSRSEANSLEEYIEQKRNEQLQTLGEQNRKLLDDNLETVTIGNTQAIKTNSLVWVSEGVVEAVPALYIEQEDKYVYFILQKGSRQHMDWYDEIITSLKITD